MGPDFSCCRLIFGEADFFPGLTIDRFGSVLVAQTLSLGIEQRKDMLFRQLVRLLRESGKPLRHCMSAMTCASASSRVWNKGRASMPWRDCAPISPASQKFAKTVSCTRLTMSTGRKPVSSSTRNITGLLPRARPGPPRARLLHAHRSVRAQRCKSRGLPCLRSGRLCRRASPWPSATRTATV